MWRPQPHVKIRSLHEVSHDVTSAPARRGARGRSSHGAAAVAARVEAQARPLGPLLSLFRRHAVGVANPAHAEVAEPRAVEATELAVHTLDGAIAAPRGRPLALGRVRLRLRRDIRREKRRSEEGRLWPAGMLGCVR